MPFIENIEADFSQLVGQEVVAKTLKQAVEQEKISHAYLFSGPRNWEDQCSSRFCQGYELSEPSGTENHVITAISAKVTEGNLEDVIEMDAASNNGVDEIR